MNKFESLLANLKEFTPLNEHKHSRVLIVDSMNTFIRGFAVVKQLTPKGVHIGGVIGYLKSIGYAIKRYNPTRVILCWDGIAGSQNRKNIYTEYKGNRDTGKIMHKNIFDTKVDEVSSMSEQIERLISFLHNLPISIISVDGLEADDVMAYMAKKIYTDEETSEVMIMSADQDFLQLVNDRIKVYSPIKKIIYDREKFVEFKGLPVENYIIYKSLMGDSSDNVPGIKGLGEKKLFKYFPELKEVVMTMDDIFSIAEEKKGEHFIYERVAEKSQKAQLKVNYQIMNLGDIQLLPQDQEDIDGVIEDKSHKLNKYEFLKKYHHDDLGNLLAGVDSWLNEFNYLDQFTNK